MPDLIYLLDTLVDKEGNILIENLLDDVAPVAEGEHEIYEKITFDPKELRGDVGCKRLRHNEDKKQLLMHRWRNPSLSIHGIEGAFSEPGAKTVVPAKVIGKFSIRIVPNQTPEQVEKVVLAYLNKKWAERGSLNTMRASLYHGGKPWVADHKNENYRAGAAATRYVYKTDPDLTREGGSIPVTLTIQDATGKNVLLLPMGSADDGAHSQNEKINRVNYIEGVSLIFSSLGN